MGRELHRAFGGISGGRALNVRLFAGWTRSAGRQRSRPRLDGGLDDIFLIINLAKELLQDIFHSDHPDHFLLGIDHDKQMLVGLLKTFQQAVGFGIPIHKDRRVNKFIQPRLVIAFGDLAQQDALLHGSDNMMPILLINADPAELGLDDLIFQLSQRVSGRQSKKLLDRFHHLVRPAHH